MTGSRDPKFIREHDPLHLGRRDYPTWRDAECVASRCRLGTALGSACLSMKPRRRSIGKANTSADAGAASVSDKFGDNGLVAVAIILRDELLQVVTSWPRVQPGDRERAHPQGPRLLHPALISVPPSSIRGRAGPAKRSFHRARSVLVRYQAHSASSRRSLGPTGSMRPDRRPTRSLLTTSLICIMVTRCFQGHASLCDQSRCLALL